MMPSSTKASIKGFHPENIPGIVSPDVDMSMMVVDSPCREADTSAAIAGSANNSEVKPDAAARLQRAGEVSPVLAETASLGLSLSTMARCDGAFESFVRQYVCRPILLAGDNDNVRGRPDRPRSVNPIPHEPRCIKLI